MGYRQTHADAGLGSVSGVVSSLPAGYELGEERLEDGKLYRLVFNAGGATAEKGFVMSPLKTGAGPFSMTVTTTSKTNDHVGAVVVHNATMTTDTYGWGLVRGRCQLAGDTASIVTGGALYIAADGQVALFPQSASTGNIVIGRNVGGTTTGTITTGAISGDAYVNLN